jgi:hypothetical protein
MIGLSVSFCIRDILEGKVKEEEVSKIIAGTCVVRPMDWHAVADSYSRSYWFNDPSTARAILWRLLERGIIEQPRVRDKQPPNISGGVWVNDESEIVYSE